MSLMMGLLLMALYDALVVVDGTYRVCTSEERYNGPHRGICGAALPDLLRIICHPYGYNKRSVDTGDLVAGQSTLILL